MNDTQKSDTQLDRLQQETFVDTVLKIIGPKIVAEFITLAWEMLPDERKQAVVIAIGEQVTTQITSNTGWHFRSIVESKVNDVARQATNELVAVNYSSILDQVHKAFKDAVNSQVNRVCNDTVKSALKAVQECLDRDLSNIAYKLR